MLTEDEVQRLLNDLCVTLGFCLGPQDSRRLRESPPSDPIEFTNAALRAESSIPSLVDRHLYRQVRDMAAGAYLEAEHDQQMLTLCPDDA